MATEFDKFKQQLAKLVTELSNHEIMYLHTMLTRDLMSRGIVSEGIGCIMSRAFELYLDNETRNN